MSEESAVDIDMQDAIDALDDAADALWDAAESWEGRRGTDRLKAYSIVSRDFRDRVLRMKNSQRPSEGDET